MGSFDKQILAQLENISRKLDPKPERAPYIENETLSKASAITSFGTTLQVAGQEFDQFVIQSDGNEDDISYKIKNLQGGFTDEIEVSKFPYFPGPVDVIQFKNDVAESGKSIFVRKIRLGKLVSPPIVLEIDKLVPHYRAGDFNTSNDEQSTGVRSENQANTERSAYTVPTGQRARVVMNLINIPEVLATSTTNTDIAGGEIRNTPQGGSVQVICDVKIHTNNYSTSGTHIRSLVWEGWFDEGDKVSMNDVFDGDAAGAGRVLIKLSRHVEEFNV